jgi:hypothetical protein
MASCVTWRASQVGLILVACLAGCGHVDGAAADAAGGGGGGGSDASAAGDGSVNTRGPAVKPTDAVATEPGPAEVAPVCATGDRKCDALTPLTCDMEGQWQPGAACPFACRDGACGDGCQPGTKSCDRNVPRLCSADSVWQPGSACSFVCLDGDCVGECTPGDMDCEAGSVPRTCSATGSWQSGTVCPFICNAGLCAGSCKPSAVRCKDNVPQRCDDTGEWQSDAACPVVCSGGQCTDGCEMGTFQCSDNVPQSCDASGRWQNGAACPFVCAAGICGGVCVPASSRCSAGDLQTCDASGAWQNTGRATQELLINPNFDLGPSVGWKQSTNIIYQESSALDTAADTPPYLAWLGGYNKADDDLYQAVTIPASTVELALSFSYKVFTREPRSMAAYDFMSVELRGQNGQGMGTGMGNGLLMTVGQLSDNDAVSTWTRFSAMLPPSLAGKTVELHFHATTDSAFLTSFYVDTVSLQAVGCP